MTKWPNQGNQEGAINIRVNGTACGRNNWCLHERNEVRKTIFIGKNTSIYVVVLAGLVINLAQSRFLLTKNIIGWNIVICDE